MNGNMIELPGLDVVVEDVIFMPSLEAPDDKPLPFAYFIRIENESPEIVTIRGRKWVVKEADGEISVIEGDGVVGKFPRLEPGNSFTYNSYHTVRERGTASGGFFGETDSGVRVFARIPEFKMALPPEFKETIPKQ